MIKTLITAAGLSVAFASTAVATPVLNFIIDGNTFGNPFSFTNGSTDGEQIIAFGIDLAGTGLAFDTVDGGVPNSTDGFPFTPTAESSALTGLIGTPVVADGATAFDLTFDNFDAGDTFVFEIDVDPNTTTTFAAVDGNELIGASVFANFSNGESLLGTFQAIDGNPDASGLVNTLITPPPAPVPLPAAGWMLLAGLGGLGLWRRRKTV